MAEPLSTQCPHCDKILKLKTTASLGKKVACPRCSEPFVVKRYKELEVIEDDVDEYEDYETPEDEVEEVRPRRSSSRSGGRSSKKGKKKSGGGAKWLMPLLIGIGVVVGVGAIGTLGYFVVGKLGGRNTVNLQYLPAETEVLMHVRPAELWNAPILADVRDLPAVQQQLKQSILADHGIEMGPTDCESVTLAVIDLDDKSLYNRHIGSEGPVTTLRRLPKTIAVMRLTKDLSDADLLKVPGATQQTHAGQTILVRTQNLQTVGIWRATSRSIVFGDVDQVKKAIDRGPSEPRLKRFDFVNAKHSLFVAFLCDETKRPSKTSPETELILKLKSAMGRDPSLKMKSSIDNHMKAGSFGLSLTSDIEFEVQALAYDSAGTKALQTDFTAFLDEAKKELQSVPPNPLPAVQAFMEIAKESLGTVKADAKGKEVRITGRVPNKIVVAVKEALASPLGAIFMQGFNQGMQRSQPPTPQSLGQ